MRIASAFFWASLSVLPFVSSASALTLTPILTRAEVQLAQGFPLIVDEEDLAARRDGDTDFNVEIQVDKRESGLDYDMSARQRDNGVSVLSYDQFTGKGIYQDGYRGTTESFVLYEVANNTDTIQRVSFDFLLRGMSMSFNGIDQPRDPFVNGANPRSAAGGIAIRYRVRSIDTALFLGDAIYNVGGANFFDPGGASEVFGADFEAWSYFMNGTLGYEFQTGMTRNLSATVTPQKDSDSPFVYGFDVQLHNVSKSVLIPRILAPGETTTLAVGAQIEIIASDYESTFSGRFGDPNGIGPSVSAAPLSAVPVPAALPALLSGLFALGWVGRRRDKLRT